MKIRENNFYFAQIFINRPKVKKKNRKKNCLFRLSSKYKYNIIYRKKTSLNLWKMSNNITTKLINLNIKLIFNYNDFASK